MKLLDQPPLGFRQWSLPVRGAWVEIAMAMQVLENQRSLPVRGAWVEIR